MSLHVPDYLVGNNVCVSELGRMLLNLWQELLDHLISSNCIDCCGHASRETHIFSFAQLPNLVVWKGPASKIGSVDLKAVPEGLRFV
jgi:hypothetical protein